MSSQPDAPTLAESLATDAGCAPADARTLGQSLARLREARGWTVADVSVRLKFSERQIVALEAENWSALPRGLSLRGLIRNYARLLGADAEALLAALAPGSDAASPGRAASSQLASERAAQLMSQQPAPRDRGWLALGVIVLAALATIAAYALGWWPDNGATALPAVPPILPE